ncbi:hypothetical protein LWI28_010706 [Acer negundo]|uniref:Retrotransposon Copia-like N-terminal domain-containing protein n=1 Tax=Acer negundo TaxID=4023 RepID=A0AAD5P048_ACENE|nr:hypothetical protein LWI28_010706 [Acer negundo]
MTTSTGADDAVFDSGSNSRSSTADPSSPYFLHHSDNPGVVLVSQLLTGENYASWSRAMLIGLSVKNKLGFIDGSITKPESTNLNLLTSWTRNNNVVISWILNSVSKEISASIIYAESAHEIWVDLRDRFQQKNGPRIFQLRRELMNLTQDQSSVSIYFTKLKTIWEELSNYKPVCSCGKCTCGGVKEMSDHYQMEYIMSFLMGLNDSYSQVRGQLLLMDPFPPINRVFALISQEEHQRKVGVPTNNATDVSTTMAFAAKVNVPDRRSNDGPGYRGQRKDRPYCTHCKIHGHTIDRCFKIHGYPSGYKPKPRDNSFSNMSSNSVNVGANPVNQVSGYAMQTDQSSPSIFFSRI